MMMDHGHYSTMNLILHNLKIFHAIAIGNSALCKILTSVAHYVINILLPGVVLGSTFTE